MSNNTINSPVNANSTIKTSANSSSAEIAKIKTQMDLLFTDNNPTTETRDWALDVINYNPDKLSFTAIREMLYPNNDNTHNSSFDDLRNMLDFNIDNTHNSSFDDLRNMLDFNIDNTHNSSFDDLRKEHQLRTGESVIESPTTETQDWVLDVINNNPDNLSYTDLRNMLDFNIDKPDNLSFDDLRKELQLRTG